MKKDTINYALYDNKDQDNLLTFANSKEELKEKSLEYTSGVWFQYDVWVREGQSDQLFNEKLYNGKPKFAKEPVNRYKKDEKEKEKDGLFLHSNIGDLR